MTKQCEKVMNNFLELDKNQKLPLHITAHLLFCKECRSKVRVLTLAEKTCKAPLSAALDAQNESLLLLMKKIDANYTAPEIPKLSFRKWIISGIFMILGMFMYIFTSAFLSIRSVDIAFYIVFVLAIFAYCSLFVGSNMDFFVKKIETQDVHIAGLKT